MIGALRTPLFIGISLAIAFSGGVYSALLALDQPDPFEVLAIGPWSSHPQAQSATANPYVKARRALGDAPGLGQAEGLLFTATTDTSGAPLVSECGYTVTGQVPASRVWILRLTGEPRNEKALTPPLSGAIHSSDLLRDGNGRFTIRIDASARSGNWLKSNESGPFGIEIVLFDTPAAGNFGLVELSMPRIERGECRDA